jgi:hypothetical protein
VKAVEAVKDRAADFSSKLAALLDVQTSWSFATSTYKERDMAAAASTVSLLSTAATTTASSAVSQVADSANISSTTQQVASLPPALAVVAARSFDMITRHFQDDVNAYGCPWEVSKSNNALKVWRSKVPGQSRMVWKVNFTISTNSSLPDIMDEFKNWDKRLKFDVTYAEGAVLKTFQDGTDGYDIDHCRTKPILTIASREFVQFRSWRHLPGESGFVHTFTSVTSEDMPGLPAPSKHVRGEVLPGSGTKFTLLPSSDAGESLKNDWAVEIVSESDLKGWIPTSVLNSAMTMVITDTARAITNHFGDDARLSRRATM